MKKLKSLIMVFVLLSLLLTGCYDAIEPDEEVYTVVIGIDKGVNNKVKLTVQFPAYKEGSGSQKSNGGGGGGSEEDSGEVDGSIITSVEAATALEGLNLINTNIPRRISLMHSKIIVFSEELARDGIGPFVSVLNRFREARRVMRIVICKETAEEFVKQNKPIIGTSISKAIELMFTQARTSGYFSDTLLSEFYIDLMSPYGQSHAIYAGVNDFKKLAESMNGSKPQIKTELEMDPGDIPRKGGAKREFFGTAVFNGDRMVGHLNSFETRCFLMVTNEFKRGIMTIEDRNKPGDAIALDIRLGRKPKIKAYFENGLPVIDVELNIEADILGIQSRINYEKVNMIDNLNNQLKTYLENGIKRTIEKTQKEWNSDIFNFGFKVAGHFSTIEEFEEYNWLKHYHEAKVNVNVLANVRRTGMTFGSEPYTNTEGRQKIWGNDTK
jgi:spore germination protein KC